MEEAAFEEEEEEEQEEVQLLPQTQLTVAKHQDGGAEDAGEKSKIHGS